jgi:hypothetical protein
MRHKMTPLVIQVLLFLLITILGIATGYLTNESGPIPAGLRLVRHWSLPLAGILVIPVIGLMFWQYRAQEHIGMPKWNSHRAPFPGLELSPKTMREFSSAAKLRYPSFLTVSTHLFHGKRPESYR